MKQTAVEWLEIELKKKGYNFPYVTLKINQAKEMEKQQIIDARVKKPLQSEWDEAEQYYNETFNTPTPWYDEDKLTERMDIIGQNGNEGEHYK